MMCRIESVFAHSPTTFLPPESNTTFFKSVNHIITSKPLLTNLILSESRPHSKKHVDWSAHFDDEVLWITIMTMWDWIEFDTTNFLPQYTMLCNPVYIIKQFITSKPTSLDVIGFSIASPCLTSTKAMPSESWPRRLCLRTWFIGFLVSKLYGAVNSILRYLIFWNYQIFSSALAAFSTVTATHNRPRWFFHWLSPEPDYKRRAIFRTILSINIAFAFTG